MSATKISLILFGIGNVGSTFINQVIKQQQYLLEEKNIDLILAVITNSTLAFFEREDQKNRWDADFTKSPAPFSIQNIIDYTTEAELENLIAIDATSSKDLLQSYNLLLENNFKILSVNSNLPSEQPNISPENLLNSLLEIAENFTSQKRQTA